MQVLANTIGIIAQTVIGEKHQMQNRVPIVEIAKNQ
jgi:hypothetical protein